MIDVANLEFDPEGLNDYLDFGFSVFGRTPVRGVHLLRCSSRLFAGPQGLSVEELDDPADAWLDRESSVDEVVGLAEAIINEAAAENTAGMSWSPRAAAWTRVSSTSFIRDRYRVRAFTYGVSVDPTRSAEAVKAAELARRLGSAGSCAARRFPPLP